MKIAFRVRVSCLLALSAAGVVTACKLKSGTQSEGVADDATRVLVGMDHPYEARDFQAEDIDALSASFAKRRMLGWQIANQIFKPVPLGDIAPSPDKNDLSLWQTWFTADEVEKIFVQLYKALPKDMRVTADKGKVESPVPSEIVECVLKSYATPETLRARYGKTYYKKLIVDRIAQLKQRDTRSLNGVAKGTTVFNLSHVRHMLANYSQMIQCETNKEKGDAFAPCFHKPFPKDAVTIKAIWARDDEEFELFDTSAAGVKAAITGKAIWLPSCDDGGGNCKMSASDASLDKTMFTARLRQPDQSENRFRLTAMHIATKETPEWTWTTLWWSQKPNEDFGEDRPDWFGVYGDRKLSELRNYKMCMTMAFEEKDAALLAKVKDFHARGDAALKEKSLQAAALASYAYGQSGWNGEDGPEKLHTWCSNPYIEKDHAMGDTNCVSCHQHAGPSSDMGFSRKQEETSFPADYQWSYEFYMDMVGKGNDNFRDKFTTQAEALYESPVEACATP